MYIEDNFIKYKEITLTMIKNVKEEEYEKLDEHLEQRQFIIDDIDKLSESKQEKKKFYLKYEINKIDNILEEEIKNKKEDLLYKIKQKQKGRMAMTEYNNLHAKAVFLSKEL